RQGVTTMASPRHVRLIGANNGRTSRTYLLTIVCAPPRTTPRWVRSQPLELGQKSSAADSRLDEHQNPAASNSTSAAWRTQQRVLSISTAPITSDYHPHHCRHCRQGAARLLDARSVVQGGASGAPVIGPDRIIGWTVRRPCARREPRFGRSDARPSPPAEGSRARRSV